MNIYYRFIFTCLLCLYPYTFSYAALWTEQQGDLLFVKTHHRPLSPHQLAFLWAKIEDTSKQTHPYVQTGVFFEQGKVFNTQAIIAKNQETQEIYEADLKPHHYYPDGSVRFGVMIAEIRHPEQGKTYALILEKKQGNGNLIAHNLMPRMMQKLPPLDVIITKNGQKFRASLQQATPETKAWFSGNLSLQRRFSAPIDPATTIDFDVTYFRNDHMQIDVVFNYNRIYETPMQATIYDAKIMMGNQELISLPNITQEHHTKWRFPVFLGFQKENIAQLDMGQLRQLKAIPPIDISNGVLESEIEKNFTTVQNQPYNLQTSGLLLKAMPTTGGRDDLGLVPQWTAQYLASGDERARDVVLRHGEIAGFIPWVFIDSKTNQPPLPQNHPRLRISEHATLGSNGIAPYPVHYDNTKWSVDLAHQPSLTYIPFIITGDRYYYDLQKAIYAFNRFSMDDFDKIPNSRTLNVEQIRSYGWFARMAGEMAMIADKTADPDYEYILWQNQKDADFYGRMFIEGGQFNLKWGTPIQPSDKKQVAGEFQGQIMTYTNGLCSMFMQDFAAMGMAYQASLDNHDYLNNMLLWQKDFVSRRFLQKHNGYQPEYATAMAFRQSYPDPNGIDFMSDVKMRLLPTWREVFQASMKEGIFNEFSHDVANGKLAGYNGCAICFPAYAAASNAMIFNQIRTPDALEAYGFLAQYLHHAEQDYHRAMGFLIMPSFLDGTYLRTQDIILGDNGDDDFNAINDHQLVHGKNGDDRLQMTPNASGFLFGGEGNDTLINHGGISYLFGGEGQDILQTQAGGTFMKGDAEYHPEADRFVVESGASEVVILDYQPNLDKIELPRSENIHTIQSKAYAKNGNLIIPLDAGVKLILYGISLNNIMWNDFIAIP